MNAVFVSEPAHVHPWPSAGAPANVTRSGWPDSIREKSGSGPFDRGFKGVWQSSHAMTDTRYRPRSTGDGRAASHAVPAATSAVTTTSIHTRFIRTSFDLCVITHTRGNISTRRRHRAAR